MKIEEFWNQAFLAALTRLPPAKAKLDADTATQMCIAQWQANDTHWAPQYLTLWQDQEIAHVPVILSDMLRANAASKLASSETSNSKSSRSNRQAKLQQISQPKKK